MESVEREPTVKTVDVLVLDDNDDLRTILVTAINEVLGADCRVQEAGDNVVGLELLLSAPRPMVVLLDYRMGPLPFDVLLSILANRSPSLGPKLARHRYLVLTASPQSIGEHERELLKGPLNGAPIVGKPFDLDELEELLRAARRTLERRARRHVAKARRQAAQMRARELVTV